MLTERERLSVNDKATLDNLINSLANQGVKKNDSDSFDDIFDTIKNKKRN